MLFFGDDNNDFNDLVDKAQLRSATIPSDGLADAAIISRRLPPWFKRILDKIPPAHISKLDESARRKLWKSPPLAPKKRSFCLKLINLLLETVDK